MSEEERIYPSMVIRSQAEAIKLLEKENKDLKEKLDCDLKWALKYDELFLENKKLKQKISTYEDPEDLTLMFMYCEEKTKDKIKELQNKIDKLEDELNWYKQECDDLEMASGECEN